MGISVSMGIGSSVFGGSAATTRYTHSSWWENSLDKYVNVYVRSRRIDAFFGVHHYIACDGIDDKWRVAEWGTKIDKLDAYATSKLYGQTCIKLGRYKLQEVYNAVKDASHGSLYGPRYNCNMWTEYVARKLGKSITVHWNCACVM